ncbi:DksA/TraR family C4-type zinc finger protein [Salmonella enterica subsp. enterica serovar Muenchen]|nr:DksA/TraR family C4-type zinc finger protein [Salmonella enterica subsp. enterica serovar Muenchen]ECZ7908497.1 DksA/TraR family C4-type zinc finger protein [Salmonella enterica subsp. enterica serovar Muenchen]
MASGWANDDAVNEQINNTIEDAVVRARGELPHGESRDECESCGDPIPEARRKAVPGVRLCIACQQEKDLHNATFSGYNRRGSKDSQLR